MRWLAATLLALCVAAAQASGELERRVQGQWLITLPDNLLTWVLQVKDRKQEAPGRVEFYAYYGANGDAFPAPVDVTVGTAGGAPSLAFTVRSGTFSAMLERDGLFTGRVVTARAEYPVRIERLSEDQIARRRLNIPAIGREARVEVVYLGTPDCRYCSIWERSGRDELLALAKTKSLGFIEVKGDTLRLPIERKHYASDAQWVYQQLGASRGVPRFLLAIDRKLVLNVYGTGAYDRVFWPALHEVLARRDGGS